MFQDRERRFVERARVGRLATADAEGRPHVVPVCFAFVDDRLVTPIDEKPQTASANALRRSRDVEENPRVALVVDRYSEDWTQLGWVQVRGRATHLASDEPPHPFAVRALRRKYEQYADHALEERPIVRIAPDTVRSWGRLERSFDSR